MRFCLNPEVWHMGLEPGEVHLWSVALNPSINESSRLWPVLSPSERSRATSFRFNADRWNFVVTRGLLRVLLAAYMRAKPEELQFSYNPYGKPSLVGSEEMPAFSVAHSEGEALYAISAEGVIGVDIERVRALDDLMQIARMQFTAEEFLQLAAMPEQLRSHWFFRYWTLKEAVVKATGEGVRQLGDFRLNLSEDGEAVLESVRFHRPWDGMWHLRCFEPKQGYAAALAVRGSAPYISPRASLDVGRLVAFLASPQS